MLHVYVRTGGRDGQGGYVSEWVKLLVIEMLPRLLRTPGTYFIISKLAVYRCFVVREQTAADWKRDIWHGIIQFLSCESDSNWVQDIVSIINYSFLHLSRHVDYVSYSFIKGAVCKFQQMMAGKMELEIELFNILTENHLGAN